MRPLKYLRIWLILGWAGVGAVVLFSLMPSPPQMLDAPSADKLQHLLAYALLMTWFGCICLPGRAHKRFALGFTALGLVLEGFQAATGYRSPEFLDALANALGVLIGWLLAQTRLSSLLVHLEARLVNLMAQ